MYIHDHNNFRITTLITYSKYESKLQKYQN